MPALFNNLKVKIDLKRNQNGQFLITGSSSPELLKNISETLAGRIAIIELGGFTWNEAYKKPISNFITAFKNNDFTNIKSLKTNYTSKALYESCFFGLYPEPFLKRKNTEYFKLWMKNYFETYINRDIRRLFPGLQFETFKRFIKMASFSNGEIINYSNFAKSLDVSQPTVKLYFDIIEGTFLWRKIPAFNKKLNKRLVKMPKGYIRDSGLVNYLHNISNIANLRDH